MSVVHEIALAQVEGIPYAARRKLLDRFASAESTIRYARNASGDSGFEKELFEIIRSNLDLPRAENEVRRLQKMGAWVLLLGRENYPKLLSQISDPPLILFGLGKLPSDQTQKLALIGPRRPTTYGTRIARILAKDLVKEGVVLVSGLARGIDAIAHEESVKAQKPTIAVLPCGLDRTYPPEHAYLRESILENGGTLLSEFFLGEPPRRENFPRRNRIVSGLATGVLVIQCGEKSGSRITVEHAIDQNRDVFSVPGPIDSPLSLYPNQLIAQGAKVVLSSQDILSEMGFEFDKSRRKEKEAPSDQIKLTDQEEKMLTGMDLDVPFDPEELANRMGVSMPEMQQMLTSLEMKGVVERVEGAQFVRVAV